VLAGLLLVCSPAFSQAPAWREGNPSSPFPGAPLGVAMTRGGLVVSWGLGPRVDVWDGRTGEAAGAFAGHASDVTAAAVSGGTKNVASGDLAGAVRIWDPSTRRESLKIDGRPSAVRAISWSPSGKHLAVTTDDRAFTVYDASTGRKVFDNNLEPSGPSESQFSPDGQRLVLVQRAYAWDGRVLSSSLFVAEYDLESGRRLRNRRWDRRDGDPDARPYDGARADARARRAAIPDGDEVVIWSLESDAETARLDGRADALAWRRDGRLVAARGGGLAVVSAETGRVERTFQGGAHVTALVCSEDGHIAVGSAPGESWVWNMLKDVEPEPLGAAADVVVGPGLVVVRNPDGVSNAIRSEDGARRQLQGDPPDPATGLPLVAVSPDGGFVVHVATGRPASWPFDEPSEAACGEPRYMPVTRLFAAEGGVVAAGGGRWALFDDRGETLLAGAGLPLRARGRWLVTYAGLTLSVHDTVARRTTATFPGAGAFDLAERHLAVLAGGDAVVVDLDRNRETFRAAAGRATEIALSPTGARVAYDDGPLQAWDVPARRRLWTADFAGPLDGLRFHPDGAALAALAGNAFEFLDSTGAPLIRTADATPAGPDGALPFAFSSDGAWLAVSWTDGPRACDIRNRARTTVLRGPSGSVRFAPAGHRWILASPSRIDVLEGDEPEATLDDASDAAFLPEASLLVATARGARVWDRAWREALTVDPASKVAVSADGKRAWVAEGTKLRTFSR
jgi:WD40 repeat protein